MLGSGQRKERCVDACWNDDREEKETADLPAIRVLVCGNTGIGKSTLINKVFGVEVVCPIYQPNDRKGGGGGGMVK